MSREPIVGNFLSKCVEGWKKGFAKYPPKPEAMLSVDNSISILSIFDRDGSHWALTPDALDLVWQTDVWSADFDQIHLPHAPMVIEYTFDYERLGFDRSEIGEGRHPCAKRFCLLDETDGKIILITGFHMDEGPDGLDENELMDAELFGGWLLSPALLIIPLESLWNLQEWIRPDNDGKGYSVDMTGKYCKVGPALPLYKPAWEKMGEEQKSSAVHDIFDELRVALGLLAVLSCDNVPVVDIPAPAKLNKKRAKAGKPPLRGYRTLHVTSHQQRGGGFAGTHASPRVHWRRGHIRNQPTAKGIVRKWIRPTIIGAGTPTKPEVVLT